MRLRILLVTAVATMTTLPAAAQPGTNARQERQESLQLILTDSPPALVASMRRTCASGAQPAYVTKNRALGAQSLPDAADFCATALFRAARDGQLLPLYREILRSSASGDADYAKLPDAIAASIMKLGTNKVALGPGEAATITPALALDAGFTVAYRKGEAKTAGMPEAAALKPIAERCLGQQERDLSLCYSTGYMYGVRAFNGLPVATQ